MQTAIIFNQDFSSNKRLVKVLTTDKYKTFIQKRLIFAFDILT